MPPAALLLKKLLTDFPQVTFIQDPDQPPHWSPSEQTLCYASLETAEDYAILLHELGHATLDHRDYSQDISLLHHERAAWDWALRHASDYDIAISTDTAQSLLDEYRQWLHDRSRCPSCHQAGIQNVANTYRCILCNTSWQANDARQCGLRRSIKL